MLRAEAERAPMFAILDAARDDRILELARQSVEAHQSLYEGVQESRWPRSRRTWWGRFGRAQSSFPGW
jgi:hypothetical protein